MQGIKYILLPCLIGDWAPRICSHVKCDKDSLLLFLYCRESIFCVATGDYPFSSKLGPKRENLLLPARAITARPQTSAPKGPAYIVLVTLQIRIIKHTNDSNSIL